MIPEYKMLRAIGFGKVTLTVKSGKKTFIYDVDVVSENPYPLSHDDFTIINVEMDSSFNYEIKDGASFNVIDMFPTLMNEPPYSRFDWSIIDPDPAVSTIQLRNGIKLGDSIGDVYAAYGFGYIRKWTKTYAIHFTSYLIRMMRSLISVARLTCFTASKYGIEMLTKAGQ